MSRKILIDSYDYSEFALDIPRYEQRVQSFGEFKMINNEISILLNGEVYDQFIKIVNILTSKVVIQEDDKTLFEGFVKAFKLQQDVIQVSIQSLLGELIDTDLKNYQILYTNLTPIEIIENLLELVGIQLDPSIIELYNSFYNNVKLNVTTTQSSTLPTDIISQLIQKILGVGYINTDNLFIFIPYSLNQIQAIDLGSDFVINRPVIEENLAGQNSEFNGIDVKYILDLGGGNIQEILLGSDFTPDGEAPKQTIDLGFNSYVQTTSFDTALFIQKQYEDFSQKSKVTLRLSLKRDIQDLLVLGSFYKFSGLKLLKIYEEIPFQLFYLKIISELEVTCEFVAFI